MLLSDLRIFLAAATMGSLSAAARQLDIAPMQASRRIAALEADLGARLFHRSTRSVSLTVEGEALMPHALSMIDAEEQIRRDLQPSTQKVTGSLRMTAPTVFGKGIILPLLPRLLAQHPDLQIDLDLTDRQVDIVKNGLDLALRVAPLVDSELIARNISSNPRVICASPSYIKLHGQPNTVNDLEKHAIIGLHPVPRWPFIIDGRLQPKRLDGRVSISSVDAARAAAIQGLGIALLAYWDVFRELANSSLMRIDLADASFEALSVWAITPSRRYAPARVKAFLSLLEAELAKLGGLADQTT